ncbi:DUF58 domain-containing protein [Lacisediminihabitans sp. G11-30]|uniref:DUF58 domain-containing protein n=2 Tax=Lacisediminihabitans changchengi TaxID=2787634 RepID=A0A934SLG1_9MICO|nr:DUF58 domain-containing protein [Lacisediminihabitans changchengi]
MTSVRSSSARSGTARSGTARSSTARSASGSATITSAEGLTNARTRIVGNRTGPIADFVITLVRVGRALGLAIAGGLRRASAVVTPLGWVMLAAVPLALGFGYAVAWIELVVVGWTILVLLAVASLYLIGRSAFLIALDVPHSRVVVGEPATGLISVTNPTRRRLLGVKVEIPVGPGLAELALPSLAKGAAFDHEFVVPTARRGVLAIGPVRTVRADPIGLVRRELVWTESTELFIHPRTIGIPSTSTGFIRDLEGNPTRDLTNSDVSFHALREYTPGDERRYIHWKSTAKTGTYMVRQFEETRRSHLVIALSLATPNYATEEEFEMAVSVAGSLGARAIRDARTVSVVVSERTPEFAKQKVLAVRQLNTLTRTRLLDDLAVVENSASAIGITDVARVTADDISGISVAFLVCGSLTTNAELRAASTSFPSGVEVVAVVCDPDTVPGLRRVAGLSVLTIGYLEDLQKSLAKSAAA